MKVKYLGVVASAIALSVGSVVAQANDGGNSAGHNWMPKQPTNNYWQTPNWSGFSMPPGNNSAPTQYARPPMPPANQQQPYAGNNDYSAPNPNQQNMNRGMQPQQNMNRGMPPQQNMHRGMPPQQNMHRGMPPQQNMNRGNRYPPQANPYRGPNNMNQYRPDNGASAYNVPGYNRNRNNNNNWNNNKFWGNSGPSRWMNPNKNNMEQGWDDMINAPSRMGEMPGGWNAPEVTMPNPIDMGDQMQDNVQDLPEQMRNMDVGN